VLSQISCKVNYSFTGASISADVKSVSIELFQNNAPLAGPLVPQQFTEALRDIFLNQTQLSLLKSNGDLRFSGYISGYTINPVAVTSGAIATAALNRLTINVFVKFENTKDEKQNFETTFSRFADFNGQVNLSTVEQQLNDEINKQLVQDIFNKAVTNW
jgi:hypothetical protein